LEPRVENGGSALIKKDGANLLTPLKQHSTKRYIMGTRGLMGVRVDGVDKLTYNHWDSYPSALGEDILEYLKTVDIDEEAEKARSLRLVQEDDRPTTVDIEKYKQYCNLKVGEKSAKTWYCLLRELQGKLHQTMLAGVMIDSHEFINDSLFCEWAYVVNFDERVLEVYKGFQREPHAKGRYASAVCSPEQGYYPCALIKEFSLNDLPKNLTELYEGKDE